MSIKRGVAKKGHNGERDAWLEKLRFLSDAMASTSQPFAAGGPEGSTMIFNEAFCRLTGYTREELYHLNWTTDLTTPESLDDELKTLEVLHRTREPQRYEKYFRRKDGAVIPVELLTHVACDSQGNILFYYSFITDISARKLKEDELRRTHDTLESTVRERTAALSLSEERLRMMIEASPVPMVVFEKNKNYFINKKFVETFGYTMDDIPSVNEWWPLAYPDDEYRESVKRRWYEAVDKAVKNKTSIEPQEIVVTCKDGSKKHVLNYFSSIGELNVSVFYDITERKMTAETLRKSEERFRSYFELPLIGIAITSPEKGWVLANDKICDMLGYPRDELMQTTWDQLTHPDDLHADVHQFNRVMSGEIDSYTLDKRFIRKDGSTIFTTVSIGCARKPDGTIDYFVGLMQDIGKRKRAEAALMESEVRFRSLIQNSSDIIRILDRDGRIVYDSPSSDKILGYPPGYTLGKSPLEFIHPDDLTHISRDLSEVYDARNRGTPSEFRIRKADGEYLDCEATGVNMIGVPGVDGIVVTTRPITERKRAEKEREQLLRDIDEQRARLQAILDALPVGVFITDTGGRIIQANGTTRKIWGGKAPLSGAIPEYGEYKCWWTDSGKPIKEEEWAIARALANGETSIGEIIDIERFDGTNGTILSSAAPIRDVKHNIIGAVAIIQDITERRKLERDLSEAKAQAELYLDLMGHDISNMHQIIMMQLELALCALDEQGGLGEKDREMLTTSLKTLDRSVNLIGNVRMLQKVRSGEYKAEPLDLSHVIDDAVKIYSDIPGRDITIKYAPSGGHRIIASPLIKDVLANLVDNAIKHSKDPVLIAIGVDRVMYKGIPYNRVSVEDNGIGIPDEKKDLIFQRFKRGQTTAKGTGLGLYIVRTLVEGFGGYVDVEDRVRGDHTKGARFNVYLPVAEARNDR